MSECKFCGGKVFTGFVHACGQAFDAPKAHGLVADLRAQLAARDAEIGRLKGIPKGLDNIITITQYRAERAEALVRKLAGALTLQMETHDQGHSPCACGDSREALAAVPPELREEPK